MRNSELFHVVIVGHTNVGKSTLMNHLTMQKVSITSDFAGTTSDAVQKRIEILGIGPVVLIDTAGIDDQSQVSLDRNIASQKAIDQASLILWLQDATGRLSIDPPFKNQGNVHIVNIFTKCDLLSLEKRQELQQAYPMSVLIGNYDQHEHDLVIEKIKQMHHVYDDNVISKLVSKESMIVFVTPIDSAAPKSRLIVPQAKLLQEALVHECTTVVCQTDQLANTLSQLNKCDLVICDSQCVKEVLELVPLSIDVTTFSIIECFRRADFKYFVDSLSELSKLADNSRILICESCTHTLSHEDIGQVKIPKLLLKLNQTFEIVFETNINFRESLEYDYIIHCGGCMINKELMMSRILQAKGKGVAMTNYGLFLASQHDGLDRCINIFRKKSLI